MQRLVAFFLALVVPSLASAVTPAVTAGSEATFALAADGTVRAWGDDSWGGLGVGRLMGSTAARQVSTVPGRVVAVATATLNSAALTSDGVVWTWGDNSAGTLGSGIGEGRASPRPVPGLSGIVAIAGGGFIMLALKADGTVWCWGSIFGCGTTPAVVPALSGAVAIAVGLTHALVLKRDGTVWAWGGNYYGQIGDGTKTDRPAPVQATGLANVVAIAAGLYHSLALGRDGRVWAWGENATSGALGDGTAADRSVALPIDGLSGIVGIAAGYGHSLAAKNDGTAWGWGLNIYGQVGDGTTTSRSRPVLIPGLTGVTMVSAGFFSSAAIRGNDEVWTWGSNQVGELGDGTNGFSRSAPVRVMGVSGVVSVSISNGQWMGGGHMLALGAGGTLWSWGSNSDGQLGDGAVTNRSTPSRVSGLVGAKSIAAGLHQTYAVALDGRVWGWGFNYDGSLGNGMATGGQSLPLRLETVTDVAAIAIGWGHALAMKNDGAVWGWGSNRFGQSGASPENQFLPARIEGLSGMVAVAAGTWHSAALKSDGTVWTWGHNANGQLGDGTRTDRSTPMAVGGLSGIVAIAIGRHRTYAVRNDGTVWGWGAGGDFADQTQGDRLLPLQVPGLAGIARVASRGRSIALSTAGEVWEWSSAAPAKVAGLPSIVSIAAGDAHVAAAASDGTVWTWGYNAQGQIGDGTYVSRLTKPVVVSADGGAGTLDANDWFLRLDPAQSPSIPGASVPAALTIAQQIGASNLDGTVKFKSSDQGKRLHTFVLARVPPEFLTLVKTAPGTPPLEMLKQRAKADDGLILAQLTDKGWTAVTGQLISYSQGTGNASGSAARILDGVSLSSLPAGSRFCMGYGENAQSMLGNQTIREVLEVGAQSTSAGGTSCVLPGVYLNGPPASRQGTATTFGVSVVGASPTGTVQFKDGGASLMAPITLTSANNAMSRASITTSSLSLGSHGIGGSYSGDPQNTWGPSFNVAPLTHTVLAAPQGASTVSLGGPAQSQSGDLIAFVAIVAGNSPRGDVSFSIDGTAQGTPVPVVEGVATLRTSSLAVGSHSVVASFLGDPDNASSVSSPFTHLVKATSLTRVEIVASSNPSLAGSPITLRATVTGAATTPGGQIIFRNATAALATVPLSSGVATLTTSDLAVGLHFLAADYSGDSANPAASSPGLVQQVVAQPPANVAQPFTLAPRSNVAPGTPVVSNAIVVRGVTGPVSVSVAGGEYSIGCNGIFTAASGSAAAGQTICVRHSAAGSLNGSAQTTLNVGIASGTFATTTYSASFEASLATLVAHYYSAVLGRSADSGGAAFWVGEAKRLASLGASINEAFFGMAMSFYSSAEYAARNRSNNGYVTDLYNTFFMRPPDSSGMAFWLENLQQGMPREVLLAQFMFSPEFANFIRAAFGEFAVRAEVDVVSDFYRGLLARAPDDDGQRFWVGRFRAAQCQGAAQVTSEVEAISSGFTTGGEYGARGRSNSQYIGDLYNAFLRRGGDLAGVQFWIGQLATRSRESVRVSFKESPEFRARVNGVIAQGCLQ